MWWVNYTNYNPTCSLRCMRFNFPAIAYSHAQCNFLQSCTATHMPNKISHGSML